MARYGQYPPPKMSRVSGRQPHLLCLFPHYCSHKDWPVGYQQALCKPIRGEASELGRGGGFQLPRMTKGGTIWPGPGRPHHAEPVKAAGWAINIISLLKAITD